MLLICVELLKRYLCGVGIIVVAQVLDMQMCGMQHPSLAGSILHVLKSECDVCGIILALSLY